MKAIHKFYKEEDGRWYIDLPEYLEAGIGTKANLEMVAGADTLLNHLVEDTGDSILLHVTDKDPNDYWKAVDWQVLRKASNNPFELGATYIYEGEMVVWLCPVTEFVFGNYPEEIYIKMV